MRNKTFAVIPFLLSASLTCFGLSSYGARTPASVARAATTRAQAVAAVRSILDRNTRPCKIDKVKSVTAARTRAGWRVTASLVMSASGRPLNETAVWTVRSSDGEAVPAGQLTAEISHGCP